MCPVGSHLGGQRISSRNSSILLTSVLTSPLKVMNGGCVPGARFWRSAGFLEEKWSGFRSLAKTEPTITVLISNRAEAPYRQLSLVNWQTKLCLAATCLSAAFNPAHLVPDVPGRQMTLARTDKNEHVLKEECENTSVCWQQHTQRRQLLGVS